MNIGATSSNDASSNDYKRIFGLTGDGLDIDNIVKGLMKVQKEPYKKMEKQEIFSEWKRDEYRGITTTLKDFSNKFMSYTNPSTNMLSKNAYKSFTSACLTSSGATSSVVSAMASSKASASTHRVVVNAIATPDIAQSSSNVTSNIMSSSDIDLNSLNENEFKVDLDGVTKAITLSGSSYGVIGDLISDITTSINTAFGAGKISVTAVGNKLNFSTIGGAGKLTLFSGDSNDALTVFNISSSASNRLATDKTLTSLANKFRTPLNLAGGLKFNINGSDFTFSATDKLYTVLNTVNSDKNANVIMTYDSVADNFIITSKQLGAGRNLAISETAGNFFEAANISVISPVTSKGHDANVSIDSQTIVRSTNTITVDGVTYELLKSDAGADTHTVTLELNTDQIFDNIKSFVDNYNAIITVLSKKLSEVHTRDFMPLIDEEKSKLSQEDAKKADENARIGILGNDSALRRIVGDMKKVLSDSVKNSSITLKEIGISFGELHSNGKMTIDENKLKKSIEAQPDNVASLFCARSTSFPIFSRTLNNQDALTRYNEEGIVYRYHDIIENNTTLISDSNGNPGTLILEAGSPDNSRESDSLMGKEIANYKKMLKEMNRKLQDKEKQLYDRFSKMEIAISKLSSQSGWLAQMSGR